MVASVKFVRKAGLGTAGVVFDLEQFPGEWASAIAGSCDAILTINAKDFPKHVWAEEGLARLDPDGFLYSLWLDHPAQVQVAADAVLAEARRLSADDWTMRSLMKKARLPRLGKALN